MQFKVFKFAAVLFAIVTSRALSAIPSFDMTLQAFEAVLNSKIREDTSDKNNAEASTVSSCRQAKSRVTCSFHDKGFRDSLAEFERLGMMSGKFALKMKLDVDIVDGKVVGVIIRGDRGDPVNLFQFVATVENIAQIWDPQIGKTDDPKEFPNELGLMRGDSDDDINSYRTVTKPYAIISCIARDSHVSTAVDCQFIPRGGELPH